MAKYRKYKLKNGETKWGVRGYLGVDKKTGNKKFVHWQGFDTKTGARIKFEQARHDFNQAQESVKTKRVKFKDLYKEFLPYYKNTNVAPSTINKFQYETDKHIIPSIGDYYIEEITIDDLQELVATVRANRKDFRKVLGHARAIFRYGVEKGYLGSNPMDRVQIKSAKSKYKQRRLAGDQNFYTTDQLLTFLNYYKEHGEFYQFGFFRLLAFAGLRRGEALGLKVSDLDHINQAVTLNQIVAEDGKGNSTLKPFTKTQQSDSKPSVVYLDQYTYQVLTQLAESDTVVNNQGNKVRIPKRDFIFTSPITFSYFHQSAPNDWLKAFWRKNKKALEDLGLHYISPHGFRHSQATMLYELGVSLKDAQHRLRHKNIKTTSDIYTHVSDDRHKLVADKLSQIQTKDDKKDDKIIQFPRQSP